jgi:serine protease inhibitor
MPATPAPRPPVRRRTFFLLGIVFELVLMLLCYVLPECWLQVEVRNFTLITHFPLMILMMVLAGVFGHNEDFAAILGLPISLAIMASIWGFLIYLVTRLVKWVLTRFIVSPRQKLVARYGAGFLGVVILVWAIVANLPATPIPFTVTPEVKLTVDGNTAFALDLYQKLKDHPGNLFFSPYSISTSLAMTYAGARGQTETEMAGVLHFNLAQTNLPEAFSALEARMHKIQRWNRITLTTANSLWCQQDYRFTEAFLNLVRKYYGAEARRVDFKRSPQAASSEINKWAARNTKGKIKGVLEPGQLTSDVRLVLCNAIYFKGKWQHQFKVRDTEPGPFHIATNQTVTVPMMHQKAHCKMASSDDRSVELLEMPYSGTDLSMIILLPEIEYASPDVENPGLPDLEQKLTADNLRTWLAELDQAHPHETQVALPRFTTTQSFDLVKELQSLGITSAFKGSADFSGMEETTNLVVSDVIHKAFVDVNESGTEAAAVTLSIALSKGMAGHFIVDHPFIFLIRENGSGSILFIGRIVDPTK